MFPVKFLLYIGGDVLFYLEFFQRLRDGSYVGQRCKLA